MKEIQKNNREPDLAAGCVIRILLVEDHQVMRQGLRILLEEYQDMRVIGEAADGEASIALALELHPNVVLMDVSLPGMSGIEATRRIHEAAPDVGVIGLSMYEEDDMAKKIRDAGAVQYISKNAPSKVLVAAIRAAAGRS